MAAPILVRDVRWTDFDDLRENYYLCYDEREEGLPIGIGLFKEKPSVEAEAGWFSDQFRQVLAGSAIGLVAEVDGKAVGACFVGAKGGGLGSEMSHVGGLGLLVRRGYRSRDIGTALLRAMINRCRGRFERVILSVFATNDGAKRLYARFGFLRYGALPRAIKRGTEYIDEEMMVLAL